MNGAPLLSGSIDGRRVSHSSALLPVCAKLVRSIQPSNIFLESMFAILHHFPIEIALPLHYPPLWVRRVKLLMGLTTWTSCCPSSAVDVYLLPLSVLCALYAPMMLPQI